MSARRRVVVVMLALVACAAAAIGAWGVFVEPAQLVVRESTIAPPGWPRALDGLRIALLSDLHVGSPRNGIAHLREVVERTNDERPDLVLLAGDFVIHGVIGGRFVPPEEFAPELAKLRAPLGTFAVLGNHDWWLSARRVREALEANGIPVIDDRVARLAPADRAGAAFWLAGVSDFWEGLHDLDGALAQVEDDAPVLVLTHNPDLFPEIPARVALTLAGHTHGGQVAVPGLGRPVVPSQYGQRYALGHVVEDGRHLFVTPGVGTSILPVRLGTPPEVSMLVLCGTGT
jgi:predicted MPP superfamily phosphohydrolase